VLSRFHMKKVLLQSRKEIVRTFVVHIYVFSYTWVDISLRRFSSRLGPSLSFAKTDTTRLYIANHIACFALYKPDGTSHASTLKLNYACTVYTQFGQPGRSELLVRGGQEPLLFVYGKNIAHAGSTEYLTIQREGSDKYAPAYALLASKRHRSTKGVPGTVRLSTNVWNDN
jgi:hypothetical protein